MGKIRIVRPKNITKFIRDAYLGRRSGDKIFFLALAGSFFNRFPDIEIPRGKL